MDDKFYGDISSELAKEAYAPISSTHTKSKKRNLKLGINSSEIFLSDPKMLGFVAAKHKFVGKMVEGFESVLEVGCMDGFGSIIVADFVKSLTSIDFYKEHIEQAKINVEPHRDNISFVGGDFLEYKFKKKFDGCFALDVLEHIDPEQEKIFLSKVVDSLKPSGVFIVGMPSIESQAYASKENVKTHINCQTASQLSNTLKSYFENVFSFGMNDEVLHTGYSKMCHYIIKICTSPK